MRPLVPKLARVLFSLIPIGCGVAGRPLPPGPLPPAAPSAVRVLSVPGGFEVEASRPTRDVEGAPLAAAPTLLLFVDDPACAGVPAAVADVGPLRWPVVPEGPVSLHVAAAVGQRVGVPAAHMATWTPPPGPPEAPLVFVDAAGGVQVAWLPAEAPVEHVVVLRDGAVVGRAPVAEARFIDAAPRGAHRYAVALETAAARSAPSPEATVLVP